MTEEKRELKQLHPWPDHNFPLDPDPGDNLIQKLPVPANLSRSQSVSSAQKCVQSPFAEIG